MTDPIEALAAYLKSDGALAALVGSRVFGGELPRAEITSMPRACLVLSPAGGGFMGGHGSDYGDQRVDFDCYGATPHDAWKVYLAAYDAMKALRRRKEGTVLLHWARPSSKGSSGRDPETEWPVTVCSYQVLAAEVAA